MTTFSDFKYLCGVLACAAALTGCETTKPVIPKGPAPLAELLNQGTQASAAGRKEEAIGYWKQATAAYSGDKAPWANIAQSRYDSGQYGEAIVSAQEVLLRDPNDKAANTIIVSAGLRLANRALGDLSRQNALIGQVRADSQDQIRQLRDNMGDAAPAAGPRKLQSETRTIKPVKDNNPLNSLRDTPKVDTDKPLPKPRETEVKTPFDLLR
ncbi:hypothetical protein F2P45_13590 [Massilia sp. CCM 8733]|uniref:Tetratricopeptide repeat protein n=1 Tax=Massilia mucilaginosa TaxID=2609282 RepID=A0ABX0NSZ7_9BURK|nr:hypothetical protein [Massilia mucilaginosa]NHZ90039.1 hypothetical protein [Massilia mucilaginosa]